MAEIQEATGVTATLIAGGRGIFDVKADGKLVFSKYALDRFPESSELAGLIHC